MKRNAEVPMVVCPKCGAEEKEAEFKPERGMCWKCWSYLAPEVGGKDDGTVMERVRVGFEGCRRMVIRPRGFWGDMVEVHESISRWSGKEVWEVKVTWSSGGSDGTLDELRTAGNFAIAVNHAVHVATTWKCERIEGGVAS
jgi:hypothetical protein